MWDQNHDLFSQAVSWDNRLGAGRERHGITLGEFERIVFLDKEIYLECLGGEGEAVYLYPVDGGALH